MTLLLLGFDDFDWHTDFITKGHSDLFAAPLGLPPVELQLHAAPLRPQQADALPHARHQRLRQASGPQATHYMASQHVQDMLFVDHGTPLGFGTSPGT